jgi:hypothetical protein
MIELGTNTVFRTFTLQELSMINGHMNGKLSHFPQLKTSHPALYALGTLFNYVIFDYCKTLAFNTIQGTDRVVIIADEKKCLSPPPDNTDDKLISTLRSIRKLAEENPSSAFLFTEIPTPDGREIELRIRPNKTRSSAIKELNIIFAKLSNTETVGSSANTNVLISSKTLGTWKIILAIIGAGTFICWWIWYR